MENNFSGKIYNNNCFIVSNRRLRFRTRKEKPSVDGGVIKPALKSDKVSSKKEIDKVATIKDNLQKTLSTPSKFNPKSLKAMTSQVLKKQDEQLITKKKFTKVCLN